jgi:hypothetical protein
MATENTPDESRDQIAELLNQLVAMGDDERKAAIDELTAEDREAIGAFAESRAAAYGERAEAHADTAIGRLVPTRSTC